jgi:hypothetical protein
MAAGATIMTSTPARSMGAAGAALSTGGSAMATVKMEPTGCQINIDTAAHALDDAPGDRKAKARA